MRKFMGFVLYFWGYLADLTLDKNEIAMIISDHVPDFEILVPADLDQLEMFERFVKMMNEQIVVDGKIDKSDIDRAWSFLMNEYERETGKRFEIKIK